MIRFCPLNSGSNYNSIYIEFEDQAVLVDAGLTRKQVLKRINEIGGDIDYVRSIIITHEHSDHTRGLCVLLKNHDIPVYATAKTLECIKNIIPPHAKKNSFTVKEPFEIGSFKFNSGNTCHDAADPVFLSMSMANVNATIITDTGKLMPGMEESIKKSDIVYLESNYDIDGLRNSEYPYYIRERIASDYGHLSNIDAGNILKNNITSRTRQVFLAHLSENTNSPEMAYSTVNSILKNIADHPEIRTASRYSVTEPFEIL